MFFREIPIVLGISEDYAKRIARPYRGEKYEYFASFEFPRPVMVSLGGVRVWSRQDLEIWALTFRARGRFGRKMSIPLLDDKDFCDQVLGRSRSTS